MGQSGFYAVGLSGGSNSAMDRADEYCCMARHLVDPAKHPQRLVYQWLQRVISRYRPRKTSSVRLFAPDDYLVAGDHGDASSYRRVVERGQFPAELPISLSGSDHRRVWQSVLSGKTENT